MTHTPTLIVRLLWGVVCFGVSLGGAWAQEIIEVPITDTLGVDSAGVASGEIDTARTGFFRKIFRPGYPNPERAAAMSFVLPGSGQVYNKRLWYVKVPAIYAGYYLFVTAGQRNLERRNDFQDAYLSALAGEPHRFTGTALNDAGALRIARDQADKNFQLSYIGAVVLHLVQTLEAYTTGHLLEFDMDESLTLGPTLLPSARRGAVPGVRLSLALGR